MKKTPEMISSTPHGIMLHHFYNKKFIKGQGAITQDDLIKIIEFYKPKNILSAHQWYEKAITNNLKEYEYCITFDDALLCQYEIALPILEHYNITAFWFIYSSVLNGNIEVLEIYRKFRTEYFATIDEFYEDFFQELQQGDYKKTVNHHLNNDYSDDYLSAFPFYSQNDKKFRFLRDQVLTNGRYEQVMNRMIENKSLSLDELSKDLWMSRDHIKTLHQKNHIIGLHSNTHPTSLATLNAERQKKEYLDNYSDLHQLTGERPLTMSHPCNSYNLETLNILKDLGIKLGFRSNMKHMQKSDLEYPREDHANILKLIN